ncbi:hypothetical protein KCV07_g285, partial [Aureobasidium melanogenum]
MHRTKPLVRSSRCNLVKTFQEVIHESGAEGYTSRTVGLTSLRCEDGLILLDIDVVDIVKRDERHRQDNRPQTFPRMGISSGDLQVGV